MWVQEYYYEIIVNSGLYCVNFYETFYETSGIVALLH